MFPPGEYGYECYLNNLAKTLHMKLIMFNDFHYYLKDKADSTIRGGICIETLAQTYIAKMKVLQPKGSYRLFGWSFGGVLAFEIMRQLQQEGEIVSHLFMLDSYFNLSTMPSVLGLNKEETDVIGDVNLQYKPGKLRLKNKTNVTLFKATQIPSNYWPKVLVDVASHYTSKQIMNGLDKILEQAINLVPINADHFEWIKDVCLVDSVSQCIDKAILV